MLNVDKILTAQEKKEIKTKARNYINLQEINYGYIANKEYRINKIIEEMEIETAYYKYVNR